MPHLTYISLCLESQSFMNFTNRSSAVPVIDFAYLINVLMYSLSSLTTRSRKGKF
jgi:hypothetical protein